MVSRKINSIRTPENADDEDRGGSEGDREGSEGEGIASNASCLTG